MEDPFATFRERQGARNYGSAPGYESFEFTIRARTREKRRVRMSLGWSTYMLFERARKFLAAGILLVRGGAGGK